LAEGPLHKFVAALVVVSLVPATHGSSPDAGLSAPLSASGAVFFEPNLGQAEDGVLYRGASPSVGALLLADRVVLAPRGADAHVTLTFPGAAAARVVPGERLPGVTNYFLGDDPAHWASGVARYASVAYEGLWPGVRAVFHEGPDARLEYDFVVAPGADAARVAVALEGAAPPRLGDDGGIAVQLGGAELRMPAPVLYQESPRGRVPVAGGFELRGAGVVGFRAGPHDPALPLVVDPLLWSTYLGGGADDTAAAIVGDGAGGVVVVGTTASTNFPVLGAFQGASGGNSDGFVARFAADGTRLSSTYMGGNNADNARSVVRDSAGNLWIAGLTASTNFPTPGGLFTTKRCTASGGCQDSFVVKLSPTAGSILYGTYFGAASGGVTARSIAVADGAGADSGVVLFGQTAAPDLPTQNALQPSYGGGSLDAFVAKLRLDGSALVYATYLGGAQTDAVGFWRSLAVDAAGRAYVTGATNSSNFPVTAGVVQPAFAAGSTASWTDAYVAELGPSGSLAASTFLGGNRSSDGGVGVGLDAQGNLLVGGGTEGASDNFPTTPGANLTAYRGNADCFVAKLSPGLTGLVYSTFVGGSNIDDCRAFAVDSAGKAYIGGSTHSLDLLMRKCVQCAAAVTRDGFVVKLSADGARMEFSTYLGGTGFDQVEGIADFGGAVVGLAGGTPASDFPVTAGAAQTTYGGGTNDGFVARVVTNQLPSAAIATVSPAECAGPLTSVPVDGSGSTDLDDPLSYAWSPAARFDDAGAAVATGHFPLGTTGIGLTVTDGYDSSTASASVHVADTIPPVTTHALAGLQGTNGWWRSPVTVTLAPTDACGVAGTFYAADGSPGSGLAFELAGDGPHSATYHATDVGGNVEPEKALELRIDATPPTVTLVRPAEHHIYVDNIGDFSSNIVPGTYVVGRTSVVATASDATSGVACVEFYVDDVLVASDCADPYTFAWDTASLLPGYHELRARALDAAGNEANAPRTVFVVPAPL
jgi:hypothetical protein